MYLIGIDFGHGETTASYINTNDAVRKLTRLHILDGGTAESSKVESAVCQDAETGKWRFIKDFTDYSSPGFMLHFKAPMDEISDSNKEAYAAFVKLVYEHILSNNDFLKKEPFCIYAACPSGWNKEDEHQIQKYKEFLSNEAPIEWVIKESDAAYFKFKAEKKFDNSKSVLVIDVGSSTIDFTAYGNKGLESLSDGKKHGASRVELEICKYFRDTDSTFKEAEAEAKIPCEENGKNWFNVVLHYVKKQKEDYYTTEVRALNLDLHNRRIDITLSKRVFDSINITTSKLEGEILQTYKMLLQKDMETVKAQIGNPNVVILTGGASRMPWLQSLVNDIFSDSEIYRDAEPSYVVSDGIAWYASAMYDLKIAIKDVIKDFWEKHTDDDLAKEISKQFNESLRNKQLPKIKAICDDFDEGKLKYDQKDFISIDESIDCSIYKSEYNGRVCTAAFLPAMIKHNSNILSETKNDIFKDVNLAMNQQLEKGITENIQEAFSLALQGFIPDIEIIPTVNINIGDLSINSDWDVERIIEMTKSIYEDIFNYGDVFKNRITLEDRRKFSIPFYELQKEANVTLPNKVVEEAVDSLKKSINAELTVENMLKKCIFSIY